jgi:hypothetical protein
MPDGLLSHRWCGSAALGLHHEPEQPCEDTSQGELGRANAFLHLVFVDNVFLSLIKYIQVFILRVYRHIH